MKLKVERIRTDDHSLRRPIPDVEQASCDESGTINVVTGQQPGLLGGPMYTFLKCATAIAVSDLLGKGKERNVTPVFWVASEDHDVLEVNRVTLHGRTFTIPYAGEIRTGKVPPVGSIGIAHAKEALLEFLRETLPFTPYTADIIDTIGKCNFETYATFFTDVMKYVFSGKEVRFLDPLQPSTAEEVSRHLAPLVRKWDEMEEVFREGTHRLSSEGKTPPLADLRLFEITPEGRKAVKYENGTFHTTEGTFTADELGDIIERRPGRFSAGAALRPLVQDSMLRPLCTVVGPTEHLYLQQTAPMYDAAGLQRPILVPRISATFLTPRTRKRIEKAGVLERLTDLPQMMKDHKPTETHPDITEMKEKWLILMEETERLAAGFESKAVQRRLRTLRKDAEGLFHSMTEAYYRQREEGTALLQRIADEVFPGGKLQERAVNVLQFINAYGKGFVESVLEARELLLPGHAVVTIVDEGR